MPRSMMTMSAAGPEPSRSPRRRQQVEHALVGAFPRSLRNDRLDADMIGTGVPMLLDTGADLALVAPRHHRIDKAVGTAAGEVVVAEALPPPAVDIILELQIARESLAGGSTRLRLIGLEQHPDLGAQQLARAK